MLTALRTLILRARLAHKQAELLEANKALVAGYDELIEQHHLAEDLYAGRISGEQYCASRGIGDVDGWRAEGRRRADERCAETAERARRHVEMMRAARKALR